MSRLKKMRSFRDEGAIVFFLSIFLGKVSFVKPFLVFRYAHEGQEYGRPTRFCGGHPRQKRSCAPASSWTCCCSGTSRSIVGAPTAPLSTCTSACWKRFQQEPFYPHRSIGQTTTTAVRRFFSRGSSVCGCSGALVVGSVNTRRLTSLLSQRSGTSGGSGNNSEDDDKNDPGDSGSSPKMRDRIRGWFRSSNENNGDPPRVKANFNGLFAGMPGINDLLSAGDKEEESRLQQSTLPSSTNTKTRRSIEDKTWFEDERRAIIENYQTRQDDILETLQRQRKEDPSSVPDNAEAMIKTVLKQEMESEIQETKQKRSRERLAAYEMELRERTEQKDLSGPINDSKVRRLIDEGEAEYERQFAAQQRLNQFLRYEAEALVKASKEAENKIKKPRPNEDLDIWALERLQDMVSRQEQLDTGDAVIDILDENLEDLRQRMEKESAKGVVQPETMKEWQMYRAIATRLGATVESGVVVASRGLAKDEGTDREVFQRLKSWKEYNEKEIDAREKGGLARGPKLPFEWQELSSPTQEKQQNVASDRELRIQTRKQINRMSIEALENLIKKSDSARRDKLVKEVEYLKQELESKDYLDVELPDDNDMALQSPVDLTGVFSAATSESTSAQRGAAKEIPEIPSFAAPKAQSTVVELDDSDTQSKAGPPPPKTPFFSGEPDMEVAATDTKLGTMEDQKLEAMYRRAGARTMEERERIKAGWEEFKRAEKEKRKVSGLDVGGEADLGNAAVKYNISEVLLEGGDIDAEKILSSIGPRPTRTKKAEKKDADERANVDNKEVVASLYRSVAAAGGWRFKDDPDAKAEDEKKFSEFLRLEQQMREKVDKIPDEKLQNSSSSADLDDSEYVKQVLSGIGPRPKPKRYERVDERYLSDIGGDLLGGGDDDDDEEDEDGDESSEDEEKADYKAVDKEDVPESVKREQASRSSRRRFLRGEEIEDAFSDDKYEKNMRQLAEYERRRSGKPGQIGIDISDVLGPRRDRDSDDYKDYKFSDSLNRGRRLGWGGATFETRKRDLMDYTELDVPMLNALMEQRDAVSQTGVSRYIAKINKPFKEFGAIFRLEGVLVDISGLQMKAWEKVANDLGLRKPSMDEVKMASVVRPDLAISDVFGWTNYFTEVNEITLKFRETFETVFKDWAKDNGLNCQPKPDASLSTASARGNLAIGEEVVSKLPVGKPAVDLTETEVLDLLTKAWSQTADSFKASRPSRDQVIAAAAMGPELAVREVFRWTTDNQKVLEIVSFHRDSLTALRQVNKVSQTKPAEISPRASQNEPKTRILDQNGLMELHYRAWTSVASAFGFDRPTSDEVLAAFVLNDPVMVVKSGFGWTSDVDESKKIANAFSDKLRALLDSPSGSVYGGIVQSENRPPVDKRAGTDKPKSAPLYDDILKFHRDSWSVCCHVHKLNSPSPEQVQLSVSMDPREFVQRVMKWSDDSAVIDEISTTFRNTMKDFSVSLIDSGRIADVKTDSRKKNSVPAKPGPSTDEVFGAALDAWRAVAFKFNLPEPTTDQVLYAISVGPEEAIRHGFRWASDADNVAELLGSYVRGIERARRNWTTTVSESVKEKPEERIPLVVVNPGSDKWIKSLLDVEMECGLVSHLTLSQVNTLLEYAGLADLIKPEKRVHASSSPMLRPTVKHYFDSQQMLAAALRLERRPDYCVVIDASPGSSVSATSVEMKSIAWIGPFPRYELLAADATVSSLDELTAMNIRRLFGERIYDQPLLDMQQVEPNIKKKTKTSYDWGDD